MELKSINIYKTAISFLFLLLTLICSLFSDSDRVYANSTKNGLHFNGDNKRVEISNMDINTKPGEKNTVEFWMKWEGTTGMPISFSGSAHNLHFSGTNFGFNTGNGELMRVPHQSFKGKWVHVSSVLVNGTPTVDNVKIYINGEKQKLELSISDDRTPISSNLSTALNISCHQNGKYCFNGEITDVRIWNHERTESQIKDNINKTLTGNEDGLVGHWNPDPTNTNEVYDHTRHKNDGKSIGYEVPEFNLNNGETGVEISSDIEDVTHHVDKNGVPIYEGVEMPHVDITEIGNHDYQYRVSTENGESLSANKSIIVEQVPDLPDTAGLNFDGINNFVSTEQIDVTSPFTVQAYIKLNTLSPHENMHIVSNWRGGAALGGGINLGYSPSQKGFYLSVSAKGEERIQSLSTYSTSKIEVDKWYKLTGIYTGNEIKLYLNDVIQSTSITPFKISKSEIPLQIGASKKVSNNYNDEFTDGRIAEVQMWERELTAEEILNETQLTGNENGLVGHWLFDNLATATVYDQSLNNYNGKAFGFTSDMTLSSSDITDMDMTLNWNTLDNATEYELKDDKEQPLYVGSGNTYEEKDLISDTDYTYSVIPKNEYGEGVAGTSTFTTEEGELTVLSAPNSIIMNPMTLKGDIQKSFGTFTEKLIVKDTRKERSPWSLNVNSLPMEVQDKVFQEESALLKPLKSVKQIKGVERNAPVIVNQKQFIDTSSSVPLLQSDGTGYGVFEITLPEDALELNISSSLYVNTDGSPLNYSSLLNWRLE